MARTTIETPGEDLGIGPGNFDVYGTTSPDEEIFVDPGTHAWFDPSFNTGGDTIYLPGEAEEYTARVEGSYLILESTINDVTVEIPVGTAGITIVFGGDDDRTVRYDTVDGRVEIDGVPVDGTADPLPVGDDVPPPPPTTYTVLADSPTVTEGDSGTRLLTYTITLDQPAEEDVTITYTTVAGGSAEINDDYQPVTGTVTIPAGSTTAFVSVPVFGDTLVEGDETINLQLSGADLEATQVLSGTIVDDDAPPPPPPPPPPVYDLSINDPTVTEGDSGVRTLTYTVTLDQPAESDVVLTYVTSGGTATENDDYTPTTGTVTIPAGATTAFISVPVLGDTAVEGDETVDLTVSSPDASGPVTGTGTIIDDDFAQTQFNLNPGSETIIGTPAPDTFRASNNELGSGDYIDGRESTDTLILAVDQDAVSLFDYFTELADGDVDYAGFETVSVEEYIVTNDSPYEVVLDMSDANGVQLVGSDNSSNDVRFEQVTSLADVLVQDITYASGTDVEVYYRDGVTDGLSDTVTVTVNNSDLDDIELGTIDNLGNADNSGIENVNLVVSNPGDSSYIDDLDTELTNLVITGTGGLEIDNALEDTVRTVDASGLAGDITIGWGNNWDGVTYDGASGDNDVYAGMGDDDIETQDGDDYVDANDGNDVVETNGGNDTVYAGSGDDTVDLGTGNNYADLGLGDDYVTATNADDVTLAVGYNEVYARDGDDTVVLGDGGSYVDLGNGDDNSTTGAGSDTIVTGAGYENISTGAGSDYVYAYGNFAGDDSAAIGRQDDIIDFGDGFDYLYVDAGTMDVDYTNVTGLEALSLQSAGTTVLAAEAQQAGIEDIYGYYWGDDVIDATAFTSPLWVYGGYGNDNIATGSANDTFFTYGWMLDDADILDGNAGNADVLDIVGGTTLATGAGIEDIEILNLASSWSLDDDFNITTDAGWVSTADGVLTVNAGGLDSFDDVTFNATTGDYSVDITTGAGADTITTSAGVYDDCVNSGAGNDVVNANAGDDDVAGGAGDDTLNGGLGDDDLHGGSGDDTLNGDDGADRFYGDAGADTLNLGLLDGDMDEVIYANVADSTGVGSDRDTINDFESGIDEIDIGELLANNGIAPASTEFISANDIDAAEAAMVAGDGVYSIVFIETLPGEPTEPVGDSDGFFFVDINDDGELGGEDLQVYVNGDDVTAGDVDTTADNLAGDSAYDIFMAEHCAFA